MSEENKAKPKTTAQKLLEARHEREELQKKIIQNEQDYAKALNDLGQSRNGKLVLKTLIRACGVFTPKEGVDGVSLIETNAYRNLYLKFIRNYLDPEVRKELEND